MMTLASLQEEPRQTMIHSSAASSPCRIVVRPMRCVLRGSGLGWTCGRLSYHQRRRVQFYVAADAAGGQDDLPVCQIRMGESVITLETGRIARQANGAVIAREGETTLLTTICTGESGSDGSFLPLTVQYQERFSAAGRTSSGFSKRDGRARDSEVLVSRLVDRPLRPVFPDGFTKDTQIFQLVMSWGGTRTAEALAITAAGAAAAISDVPLSKPVAGVRVGWPRGAAAPVINPTVEQARRGRVSAPHCCESVTADTPG